MRLFGSINLLRVIPLKTLFAVVILSLSTSVSALPSCPSSHFQPATYYGQAFSDTWPITEHEVLKTDEDLALQIIVYQTFEPIYEPVFSTSLIRSHSGRYRAALVRAKKSKRKSSKPTGSTAFREIPTQLADRAVAGAAIVLRGTRYPATRCTEEWLDGYVVQALVADLPVKGLRGFDDLVGEVYAPPNNSQAGAIVALGRTLRSYVEGSATVQELEAVIVELERHNSE